MNYWLKKLAWLLPCLCSSYACADEVKSEYRTWSRPTMAVFYGVTDDGRSIRQAIEIATISDPDAEPSRVVVTGRQKSRRRAQHDKPVLKKASISIRHAQRNSFSRHRCERFGFYYTNAGDCVVPVRLRQQELCTSQSKCRPVLAKPLTLMFSGVP